MASDISSILQNELTHTFESLLSLTSSVDNISLASQDNIASEQCVKVSVDLKSKTLNGTWNFYLPTLIATKFEYHMLGEMGDIKSSIDDEIADAAKEIISTIVGSISTSIDSQGFDDLSKVSFTVTDSNIVQGKDIEDYSNLYLFDMTFNDDSVELFIQFDGNSLDYLGKIVDGEDIPTEEEEETNAQEAGGGNTSGAVASILSLLGEESTENLKLLFGVKLRFSVRLGTKTFLLKDIVNWDVGQIIELEQMVNEPLDILINGIKVGVGEAVIVEGRFGVKIKYIGDNKIEV